MFKQKNSLDSALIEKLKKTKDDNLLYEFPGFKRSELRRIKNEAIAKDIKAPKILILDIETSPLNVYSWGLFDQNIGIESIKKDWFILSWSSKWLLSPKVISGCLSPKEAIEGDDSRITKDLWLLLNEADIVVGHNCLEKTTPVLTTSLEWKPAGELVVGEKLVGFEENNSKNQARQIQESVVESNHIEKRKCYKVTLDNGEEITATPEHKWLKLAAKGRDYRWCTTENLKIGQRIEKFLKVWEKDTSYESGWLSGFISGEGTLKGDNKMGQCCNSIDFCQRPGVTWNKAVEYCKQLGIDLAEGKVKKGGLGKGDTLYTYTKGGKFNVLEVLGKLGIDRLINKIDFNKFGSLKSQISETRTIVKIEDAGVVEVSVLTTSTKTYIAAGYPMHNCDKFDIKRINTRFLFNGLSMPKPYRTVDTLKIAKKYFSVSSNKLDYLCRFLGLDTKIETGGMKLWLSCLEGKRESLNKLSTYCANDVLILEELYLKIRQYDINHPNANMYITGDPVCNVCSSPKLVEIGTYKTQVGEYKTSRCKCGAIIRSNINERKTKNIKKEKTDKESSEKEIKKRKPTKEDGR